MLLTGHKNKFSWLIDVVGIIVVLLPVSTVLCVCTQRVLMVGYLWTNSGRRCLDFRSPMLWNDLKSCYNSVWVSQVWVSQVWSQFCVSISSLVTMLWDNRKFDNYAVWWSRVIKSTNIGPFLCKKNKNDFALHDSSKISKYSKNPAEIIKLWNNSMNKIFILWKKQTDSLN